jgi:hypothetical protein
LAPLPASARNDHHPAADEAGQALREEEKYEAYGKWNRAITPISQYPGPVSAGLPPRSGLVFRLLACGFRRNVSLLSIVTLEEI